VSARPLYSHTQRGWALILAAALGALFAFVLVFVLPPAAAEPLPGWLPALIIGAPGLTLLAFGSLTVTIAEGQLTWRFGLGWPRKSLPLAEITLAEPTRTRFIEGWGIHLTRRGWLYNVSGFDAVLLTRRDGKSVLIGTDEPRALVAALERARAARPAQP
jgi:hypothetical protein